MKIILTHEQTDFDGIASLLGASLIDETSKPVLPRRINRNVRAFITIYGAELPFIDPRDLADQPIDMIYLVDTQSLISIKGVHAQTQIHVVDHHPLRDDLPAEWDHKITATGANTTIFVEEIQERGIQLSVVQATLLLLGIYEDTGSLTYSRTTSRDIRAAANLLDSGANLAVISDYLNHPLSLEQQSIYDQLRAGVENHRIRGHAVIIASGDASKMDEELSTIAHKLRDFLDPDAIILLIKIRGGVQLIARSTNDKIDVAQIAGHFGGGGHLRAAAALIKSRELATIHAELIEILPDLILPAITVAEIMSNGPQLLSPETPVQEISRRMTRYGYEGYPVVDKGKVLGLVTRRAVDRTLSHKLNLNAEKLMDAGEFSITPDRSIEELQSLMTSSGWGQIPVIDPTDKNIIGIVTRTDLLKTLAPQDQQSEVRNLTNKLEKALPPERLTLLKEIAKIAQNQCVALYIVGGFVRDLLMDHPSQDFDLVVEGDAIDLAQRVCEKFGGRITTHQRFGTAKWFLSADDNPLGLNGAQLPETLDFITARREFYTHPTALPTIERGSIKLDLHRRDFTINTLALRLDGHRFGDLLDFWGGDNDIRQGLVRILHSISFVDDPTRMLRAIRYEQRYQFTIGKRTLDLLLQARPLMSRVSGDRIRHEIDNIFNEEKAAKMFDRLQELGLLTAIHTDLIWNSSIKTRIDNLNIPAPEWGIGMDLKRVPIKRALAYTLWLMRVPQNQAEGIVKRLRLSGALKHTILAACQLWVDLKEMGSALPSEFAIRLDNTPPLAIYTAYLSTDDAYIKNALFQFATRWKDIKPYNTGRDLQAKNLRPGPYYKEILNQLRAAWIDEKIESREQEQALFDQLIEIHLQTS